MMNRPPYPHLVRYFLVRDEVYDKLYVSMEQSLMVQNDNSLKDKSIKEMGLKKFELEIRYAVMNIDVIIIQKTISKVLKKINFGRFHFEHRGKQS